MGMKLGFWDGADLAEICHQLTAHDASFWRENADECSAMYGTIEDAFCRQARRYGHRGSHTGAPHNSARRGLGDGRCRGLGDS